MRYDALGQVLCVARRENLLVAGTGKFNAARPRLVKPRRVRVTRRAASVLSNLPVKQSYAHGIEGFGFQADTLLSSDLLSRYEGARVSIDNG